MGVTGIVTFPSFHAASCLLYTWAFWPVRWMRPITLAANGLMLASTPIDGGHYFIDVFAGLALAAAAIALVNRITVTISSEGKVAPVFRPISSALAGAAGR
jgi:membrane-associated phospholipid phosphatase